MDSDLYFLCRQELQDFDDFFWVSHQFYFLPAGRLKSSGFFRKPEKIKKKILSILSKNFYKNRIHSNFLIRFNRFDVRRNNIVTGIFAVPRRPF